MTAVLVIFRCRYPYSVLFSALFWFAQAIFRTSFYYHYMAQFDCYWRG